MPPYDAAAAVRRHDNCCFPLVLIVLVGGGLVLQIVGFAKLRPFESQNGSNLCAMIPSRAECKSVRSLNEFNRTILTEAEDAYVLFLGIQGTCMTLQICAMFALLSRILCCAEIVCVTYCHRIWAICAFGGLVGILILEGFSGVFSLCSCINLGCNLSTNEIKEINGFDICVINGVFQCLKVVVSIGYHKLIGFPPNDFFIGSSVRYSDVRVTTNTVRPENG